MRIRFPKIYSFFNFNRFRKQLDYALFPTDGIFNMGFEEAVGCTKLIGAKHNIPIHMNPLKKFDKKRRPKNRAHRTN